MSNSSLNIFDSIVSNQLTEISSDILEAEIDQLISNEFLKDIPIIGLGIKSFRLAQSISESFFMKKILRFLFQLKDIPQEKRERFANELGDRKKCNKAGETVLIILNKLDDINKATIIGKLLGSAIERKITYSDFMRLSYIVDRIFIEDLFDLKNNKSLYNIDSAIKTNLYQAGLLIQTIQDHRDWEKSVSEAVGANIKHPPSFEYKINEFGKLLIQHGL